MNTYLLYCIADSVQCWDQQLWEKGSSEILKTLHMNKSMINFEELGWYLMSKYPDLYKFGVELQKEENLSEASQNLLQIKTMRIANKVGMSSTIMLSEDTGFSQKAQSRHQMFLDFLENGNPEEMSFNNLIKITGSMDYMSLKYVDIDKNSKFINMGYKMLEDFMAGKLDIKSEDVGEAYLFFKEVLRETTRRVCGLPFKDKDVLYNCVIPQLENVRNGCYPTIIKRYNTYSTGLSFANKEFNKRYYQTVEGIRQRQEQLSKTMQEHTFITSHHKCRKDDVYYDALYNKILCKYASVIAKYECGVEKYAGLNNKIDRVLNAILDRKKSLEQNNRNLQQPSFSLKR